LLLTLVLVGGLAGLCLLYLEQTSRVVELGYELTRLQREREQVALEVAALRYQLAQRESLARVDDLARREYGMVPLRYVEALSVERPVPTAVPTPTAPAQRPWWQRVQDALLGIGHAEASEVP
jgi:cell division protein FtsL